MIQLPAWVEKREQEERQRAGALGLTLEQYQAQRAEEHAREEMTRNDRQFYADLVMAGVPERALDALVGHIIATEAMQWLADELRKPAPTELVVLSGTPGVGKTVAAAAWLISGVMDPRRGARGVRWVQAAELARGYAYEQEAMAGILQARRLVIDDLGVEFMDAAGRYLATLDEIVAKRHGRRLPTLLTTNCKAETFKQRYQDRIASRVNETGRFVQFTGGEQLDRRRNNQGEPQHERDGNLSLLCSTRFRQAGGKE